jgi:hypothetical protein
VLCGLLKNDSLMQMFSPQHLFRNDTAADPALLRGGSSDTDPCGAGGSADLSLPESALEQSPSVFSRMQSGHLARIDHNLWQVCLLFSHLSVWFCCTFGNS